MKYKYQFSALIVIILFTLQMNTTDAQTMERSEMNVEDTWNLEELFQSDAAWKDSKKELQELSEKIGDYKGKLGNSAGELLKCLKLLSQIEKGFYRLHSYAFMKSDQDTRVSENLALVQEISQVATDIQSKASYIDPEILSIDKQKLESFFKDEPGLKAYEFHINNLIRSKKHTLSEKEEKIIAETSLMADGPSSIYSIFKNAELPYPEITLSNGEKVVLNSSGYSKYRGSSNRADRELVFQEYWTTMSQFKKTFGEQLYWNIKKDIFYTRVRGHESSLHSALHPDNIPVEVYKSLIKSTNDNLPTLHRYLKLKQRMLNVDTLKYSDLYASVIKNLDIEYSFEEAKKNVLESISPLGNDYTKTMQVAFDNRWIDIYPNPGKRSGAYMSGMAYDVHPYVLLNYNNTYSDVSTLAHEMGHAMHSYFSNKTQPYPVARYSIFNAEVASTLNELLLNHSMVGKSKDDNVKLTLLMGLVERFRATLFRQTQFAEFELKIHEVAEQGEPLTGDILSNIYGDIIKRYYGHDQGICIIDDLYFNEWTFVPHFYYNFYVYQYATSLTASCALAEKILDKEKGAVEKYVQFISSGGSDYPIHLLKNAGVDMTTSEPFELTMNMMNSVMDEIEKILDKKK